MIMVNFKQLMFDKGLNQSDLAQIWGISQSLVSKVIRGERGVPVYYIDKLVERFGEDVINQYTTPDKPFEGITQTAEVTLLTPEVVAEIKEEVREEIEEVESFPVLPEDVTTSPNTDVLKYVEENGSELETINPNQLLIGAKVDVAERIKRTSMLPTFQPEDTVFIRFITNRIHLFLHLKQIEIKKLVCGDPEKGRDRRNHSYIGHSVSVFPLGNGLKRHAEIICKYFLRNVLLFS